MLELFILKQKIKGPCWLTVQEAVKVPDSEKKTWCKYELMVADPKKVSVTVEDLNKDSPPLVGVSLAFKTCRNSANTNEIAMISCLIHKEISQDGITNERNLDSFTLVRRLDKLPFPSDLDHVIKQRNGNDKSISKHNTERELLEVFITNLSKIDPDMIISHNLCSGMMDLLLSRF